MKNDTVTIHAKFNRETDTAIVHWSAPYTSVNPDSTTDADSETTMTMIEPKTYEADLPAVGGGTTVGLAIQTDGINFDKDGNDYRYKVDQSATP
ncbi:MAG: hypothetical protein ABEJ65_06870, partial [bacterium]